MFALIDCNNFYASCQRVFQPHLCGQPVVVLSNNDGCIIARSNEAKEIGIPMGAPAFQYEEFFVKHKVAVFSANFPLYGDMSQRVMSLLAEYSPEMEVYSIDEAFLCLEGFDKVNLQTYGEAMQKRVTKNTGIPISVGIAPTKALAKIANRIAKKFSDKTKNIYLMDTEVKRIKALKWLSVGDVWGIGRQLFKRLEAIKVKTAYDFTQLEDAWVQKNFGIVGLRLKRDLEGIPTLNLEEVEQSKSIATTRTFEENYTTLEQVKERVTTFAVACAEKLRRQKSCCNVITVFVKTNKHRTDHKQYHESYTMPLPFATNSSIEIAGFAIDCLGKIFREGLLYKKAGVILQDFVGEDQKQIQIFQNSDERHKALMESVDKINATYGQQKIKLASQDLNKIWKMRQERLSPFFTTRLSDIITIHT